MSAFTLPTTLDGWLTLLETRHAKPIDLGLERVGEVYRRLGIQLPGVKFVVAGTNGKGSTCAMLDAILRAAGYRVGLHTSPHLLYIPLTHFTMQSRTAYPAHIHLCRGYEPILFSRKNFYV